jgi:hypothetical protein
LVAAGLRVAGRNTAFVFKGKHPTPREVGKVAGGATVLSVQVRRLGEQYTKESGAANAFALQRALVDSIIARFQPIPRAITAGEATDATVSAAAHDYVVRGKSSANQYTPGGIAAAVALYDSALLRRVSWSVQSHSRTGRDELP